MSAGLPLDAPRAPSAPHGAGLYESHYLTAVDPEGGRAVWIRYTAHKEKGQDAHGTLWCTVFDTSRDAPHARRVTSAQPLTAPAAGGWASIDGATIGPGRADGAVGDCSWALSWHADAPAMPYLPSAKLYDRPIPRSNGVALVPAATFSGEVRAGSETLDVTGWRGMVGHNWGADHADRWLWLHATGLGDRDPAGWLDLVVVRVKVGPVLTPWLPAGGIQLDGVLHRVGAPHARGMHVDIGADRLTLQIPRMPGGGLRLETASPVRSTVHWDYDSPGGGGRDVRNCTIAGATVRLADGPPIALPDRFAVEVGT